VELMELLRYNLVILARQADEAIKEGTYTNSIILNTLKQQNPQTYTSRLDF
jgi:hypothetical protein